MTNLRAGAPLGNKNARKGAAWTAAVRRAALRVAITQDGVKWTGLDALAAVCVAKAMTGDMAAITEIGNRLDGKPVQPVGGDDGGKLELIVRMAYPDEVEAVEDSCADAQDQQGTN